MIEDSEDFEVAEGFDKELIEAAKEGDCGAINTLLRHAWAYARDDEGKTALMHAAARGHAQAVALLLPLSAVNAKSSMGVTALHFAAHAGYVECVRLLVEICDARAVDHRGGDAMIEAAARGNIDCVEILAPLAIEQVNKAGQNALFRAAANGELPCVRFLAGIQGARLRDNVGGTPLLAAATSAAWDCVRILAPISDVKAQTTQNDNLGRSAGFNALMAAAAQADPETVAFLLSLSDAEAVDADGRTAMMQACAGNAQRTPEKEIAWAKCVELLLPASDPAQVDDNGSSAFDWAVRAQLWGCVDVLSSVVNRMKMDALLASDASGALLRQLPRWAAHLEREALMAAAGFVRGEAASSPPIESQESQQDRRQKRL